MNYEINSNRYTRVYNDSINGFDLEFDSASKVPSLKILKYCEGKYEQTGLEPCPFSAICSKQIINGRLPLESIYDGSTANDKIARLSNKLTDRDIPTNRFGKQDMKATFIGMTANCTDPSTKATETTEPERPRYAWQDRKNCGGDD
jgi:hypothetical protein